MEFEPSSLGMAASVGGRRITAVPSSRAGRPAPERGRKAGRWSGSAPMRDGKGCRGETFDLGLPILCAMSRWKAAKASPGPDSPDPDDEILVRRDLCSGCWQGDEAPERESDLFWWFTRHQEKVSRSVSLDLDSLEQLFLQLEGKGERPVRELRYVLCLLLMRKRRIKVERVLRDAEGESFLVKRPRRDERYKVFVYDFDAERMAEIRDELQAIFDGAACRWPKPETPPTRRGTAQRGPSPVPPT